MTEIDFQTTSSLIIDSDKFARTFIKNALSQIGCKQIKEATDAEAAAQMLSTAKYDFVLVEQYLGEKDGISLIKDLRSGKHGEHKDTPVIMISSEAPQNLVSQAKTAGVNLFLVKPISPASLKKRITYLLGQK